MMGVGEGIIPHPRNNNHRPAFQNSSCVLGAGQSLLTPSHSFRTGTWFVELMAKRVDRWRVHLPLQIVHPIKKSSQRPSTRGGPPFCPQGLRRWEVFQTQTSRVLLPVPDLHGHHYSGSDKSPDHRKSYEESLLISWDLVSEGSYDCDRRCQTFSHPSSHPREEASTQGLTGNSEMGLDVSTSQAEPFREEKVQQESNGPSALILPVCASRASQLAKVSLSYWFSISERLSQGPFPGTDYRSSLRPLISWLPSWVYRLNGQETKEREGRRREGETQTVP